LIAVIITTPAIQGLCNVASTRKNPLPGKSIGTVEELRGGVAGMFTKPARGNHVLGARAEACRIV
jgi:hypothetical protein